MRNTFVKHIDALGNGDLSGPTMDEEHAIEQLEAKLYRLTKAANAVIQASTTTERVIAIHDLKTTIQAL
jgi:hypothetical protein